MREEIKLTTEVVAQYLPSVYGLAYRLTHDQNATEDLTQEVFVKVWKNLKKFDQTRNFKTWLLAITRNTTIDWLRKKRELKIAPEELSETLPDLEPLPDEVLMRKEIRQELETALASLAPDEQTIIALHHTEGLTLTEIAEVLDQPVNSVKSRYHRALHKLRLQLLHPN